MNHFCISQNGDERSYYTLVISKRPIKHFLYPREKVLINYVPNVLLCYLLDINLLKPTGYEMHQQFNIQQLYALPTLYLCVLCLSENKQRLVPLTA